MSISAVELLAFQGIQKIEYTWRNLISVVHVVYVKDQLERLPLMYCFMKAGFA